MLKFQPFFAKLQFRTVPKSSEEEGTYEAPVQSEWPRAFVCAVRLR